MWGLFDLVSAWWDGTNVSGRILWGHEVAFWGRMGKLAQFAAGLAVVLDLLSPDKLRARGAAARRKLKLRIARQRRRKTARWVEGLHKSLDECLDFASGDTTDLAAWVAKPIPRIPAGFPEEELRAWVRATRAELHPENWTTTSVATSAYSGTTYTTPDAHDRAVINRREWEFLRPWLPRYAVATWLRLGGNIRRLRIRAAMFWAGAALVWSVLPSVPGMLGADFGLRLTDTAPGWVILPSAAMITVAGFVALGAGELFTARLLRLPQSVFYFTVASLLDKARPAHVLRWIAFVLFILGFFFDLLTA